MHLQVCYVTKYTCNGYGFLLCKQSSLSLIINDKLKQTETNKSLNVNGFFYEL